MFMRQYVIIPTMEDLKERIDKSYPFDNLKKYSKEEQKDYLEYAHLIAFLHEHTVEELFFQLDKGQLSTEVQDDYYKMVDIIQELAR